MPILEVGMQVTARGVLVGLWIAVLAGAPRAQGFEAGLAALHAKIEARQWKEALDLLLGLQGEIEVDEDCEVLAARLKQVGEGLVAGADFSRAHRAFVAQLAMWKRRHGEADAPEIASSLNSMAYCLNAGGRAADALPLYEQALAMKRRLAGDRDDASVALGMNNLANCLHALGRRVEALAQLELALAMRRRIHGEHDHPEFAGSLNNVAACLQMLGRADDALPLFEQALAMMARLYRGGDHAAVGAALNNVGYCLKLLGRTPEALVRHEAALAMQKRLRGERDHPEVATSLNNVASCHLALGSTEEALLQFEQALAMNERLYGDRDHADVAVCRINVAECRRLTGRAADALPLCEQALAMLQRLLGDRDHAYVAGCLQNVAECLLELGRPTEALPWYEHALAMRQRSYGDRDHPEVAQSLNGVAYVLRVLGRAADALVRYEQAFAMRRRLYGNRDHPEVASNMVHRAACLVASGRSREALLQYEEALAMHERLYGDRDHAVVAESLGNKAGCLDTLGRWAEALSCRERSLAMRQRLHGYRDHPEIASERNGIAHCLFRLGRHDEALRNAEAALAMRQRRYGGVDHPDLALDLSSVAACLQALGRPADALPFCMRACEMIERLREGSRASAAVRQSYFDALKRAGAFELLQALALPTDVGLAIAAAERSRGRDLLDLLEQQHFDPVAEAERRAAEGGDALAAGRFRALRDELAVARLESDRVLHLLTRLDDGATTAAARDQNRAKLLAESNAAAARQRQVLDERARLLADVLPVGKVAGAAEIGAALLPGELLLEYTLADLERPLGGDLQVLYVIEPAKDVQAFDLSGAIATANRVLPAVLAGASRAALSLRGRDPDVLPKAESPAVSHELFTSLVPQQVWQRLQGKKRVFVVAHRALHRLPFELLVTEVRDAKPVYWLDSGPPIAYVPSGSALRWLRRRPRPTGGGVAGPELLAVGDPGSMAIEPEVPARGAFIAAVEAGGRGRRAGLRVGDVVLRYDGRETADQQALANAWQTVEAAIQRGARAHGPVPIEVWRHGEVVALEVDAGLPGVQVPDVPPRLAHAASFGAEAERARIARDGDVERARRLPPLRGAKAEVESIVRTWRESGRLARALSGADATEASVFQLAAGARYLHFACHGIAEEYAGQSLSMLVLSQPDDVRAADDGFLKLGDLLSSWRGRLSSCRLVVLSACCTNVGPTHRDESPQALPIGFLFAGAPAVVSSLWAVDDVSTRELMTDFHARLLTAEADELVAFTAAKKAMRGKYPDPFHWAPFLFVGAPE